MACGFLHGLTLKSASDLAAVVVSPEFGLFRKDSDILYLFGRANYGTVYPYRGGCGVWVFPYGPEGMNALMLQLRARGYEDVVFA